MQLAKKRREKCSLKKTDIYKIIKRVDEKISSCCHKVYVPTKHYNSIKIKNGKVVVKHWRECTACGRKVEVNNPESCTCHQNG